MKEKLYRSLTPVSTAATAALSLDRSESGESNHTYEPIETAGQAVSSDGEYRTSSSQIPVTLISHDGTTVTAKTIVNLDNLREVLHQHEQIPYEDPENRGDLYLLAPMRLLTPIGEETESDITGRSKTYQALSTQSKEYSDVDQSIMSKWASFSSGLPFTSTDSPNTKSCTAKRHWIIAGQQNKCF